MVFGLVLRSASYSKCFSEIFSSKFWGFTRSLPGSTLMPTIRAKSVKLSSSDEFVAFALNARIAGRGRVTKASTAVKAISTSDPRGSMPADSSGTVVPANAITVRVGACTTGKKVEVQAAAVVSASTPKGKLSTSVTAALSKKKTIKAAALPSVDPERLEELRQKAARIAEQLQQLYPNPPIPLDHASDFQLLCAVLLSAQTTDKKVNEVTPRLFQLAPDAAAMAAADLAVITDCIKQLGLAPTKAKNLKAMSQMLVSLHGGNVPASFAELEALPGVGHKTASVVMAQAFGHSAFPVDTHIHRLAQRWGLTAGCSVEQTEADLKLLLPEPLWRDLHLQIIFFGRGECPALRHDPSACPICCWAAVPPYDKVGASPLKPGQRAGSGGGARTPSPGKRKASALPEPPQGGSTAQREAQQADVAPAGRAGRNGGRAKAGRRNAAG